MAGTRTYGTHLDLKGNRIYNEGTLNPSTTTALLDFADTVDNVQLITIGLATTFTTANLAAGRSKDVLISSSLVAALTFPVDWKWYGSKLALTVVAKEIRLRLKAYGSTDGTVRAEFVVQS